MTVKYRVGTERQYQKMDQKLNRAGQKLVDDMSSQQMSLRKIQQMKRDLEAELQALNNPTAHKQQQQQQQYQQQSMYPQTYEQTQQQSMPHTQSSVMAHSQSMPTDISLSSSIDKSLALLRKSGTNNMPPQPQPQLQPQPQSQQQQQYFLQQQQAYQHQQQQQQQQQQQYSQYQQYQALQQANLQAHLLAQQQYSSSSSSSSSNSGARSVYGHQLVKPHKQGQGHGKHGQASPASSSASVSAYKQMMMMQQAQQQQLASPTMQPMMQMQPPPQQASSSSTYLTPNDILLNSNALDRNIAASFLMLVAFASLSGDLQSPETSVSPVNNRNNNNNSSNNNVFADTQQGMSGGNVPSSQVDNILAMSSSFSSTGSNPAVQNAIHNANASLHSTMHTHNTMNAHSARVQDDDDKALELSEAELFQQIQRTFAGISQVYGSTAAAYGTIAQNAQSARSNPNSNANSPLRTNPNAQTQGQGPAPQAVAQQQAANEPVSLVYSRADAGKTVQLFSFRFNAWENIEVSAGVYRSKH
jgi:hypothetical protein